MNENIDLTQILKNCPKGTEFYSSIFGKVSFMDIDRENLIFPILVEVNLKTIQCKQFTKQGKYYSITGECVLFPSKDQRDWNKFTAPWYKKEKFNTKTLQPFDKVLCKNGLDVWHCDFFSCYMETWICPNACISDSYMYCIPYNDETKHLVGTRDEAPEYYRYWED